MDPVIVETPLNVVTNVDSVGVVNIVNTETTIVDNNSSLFIVTPDTSSVLVEVETSQVVLAGAMGPAGISEDEMVYSKQYDFDGDNIIYRGEASVGSLSSAPLWRIRKITTDINGDISETWAAGNAQFNKVWDDRLTYTYL